MIEVLGRDPGVYNPNENGCSIVDQAGSLKTIFRRKFASVVDL